MANKKRIEFDSLGSKKIDQNKLKLPDNFEILIEINNFLVLRMPKDIEYSNFGSELGLRKI